MKCGSMASPSCGEGGGGEERGTLEEGMGRREVDRGEEETEEGSPKEEEGVRGEEGSQGVYTLSKDKKASFLQELPNHAAEERNRTR